MRQPSFEQTLRGPRKNHPLAQDLVFAILFNQPGFDRLYDVSGWGNIGELNLNGASSPTIELLDTGVGTGIPSDVSTVSGFEYDFGSFNGNHPLGFSDGLVSFAWRGDLAQQQSDNFPRFGADKSTDGQSNAGANGYTWWLTESNDTLTYNVNVFSTPQASGQAIRRTTDETITFSTFDSSGDHRWGYRNTSGDVYTNFIARSYTSTSASATFRMFNRGDGNRALESPAGMRYFLMWRTPVDPAEFHLFFEEASNVWEIWDHRPIVSAAPPPGVEGSGSFTLSGVTVVGSGQSIAQGSGAFTLSGVSVSGAGQSITQGSGAFTLNGVDVSGAGTAGSAQGSGSFTLAPVAVSGQGQAIASGSGSFTLNGVGVSGSGVATAVGSGAFTLNGVIVSGTGAATAVGSGSFTLNGVSVSGAGNIPGITQGSGAFTLNGVSVSGEGFVMPQGSGAFTLAGVSVSGSGSVPLVDWSVTAYSLLTGSSDLTNIVSDKICIDSPLRGGYPGVVLRTIDGTPTPTLLGDSDTFGILVEINTFARTRREATRAYNATRKALTSFNSPTFSAVTESYASVFHDLDESRFRAVGTIRVWTNEIEAS